MALQLKRGTNAFRLTQTLLAGEPFFVTDAVTLGLTPLWIGNGTTLGGVAAMDANTLNELTDVNAAVPVNKDLLQYSSSTGTWTNSQNLNVAGTTTLTGGVTASGAVSVAGTVTAAGAVTVAGLLTSAGGIVGGAATHTTGTFTGNLSAVNVTASGDLAVNGGDITSTNATANLFNDYNHTSINIGNAATGTVFLGNAGNTTTVKGALTVGGNLTVNGTTTSVNSTVVNIKDEMITLNFGEAGTGVTPSTRRAGIQVDRGTSADVSIQWNEQTDQWELTNDGTNYSPIALGFGFSSNTDIVTRSITLADYLKILTTGPSNYFTQQTANNVVKWTLNDNSSSVDSPTKTYKLSYNNVDKFFVSNERTSLTGSQIDLNGPTTIGGQTTINSGIQVGDSGTPNSASVVLHGPIRTGNSLIFNHTVTGTPTSDATITVDRGTSTDATFAWNETNDRWTASDSLYVANNIINGGDITSLGNIYSNGNTLTLNNDQGSLLTNDSYGFLGLTLNRQADAFGSQRPARINWNETERTWEFHSPDLYGGGVTVSKTSAGISGQADVFLFNPLTNGTTLVYQSGKWVAMSYGTGLTYSQTTGGVMSGQLKLNDSYAQTLARSAISAGTGISYNSSTGVISLNSGLDPLTDVAVASVAKGQLLSYNGTQWVNTNTLSADSTANRLNLEINSSTAGVTNAMVMRKNFGAGSYANNDGTGIRFEVDSVGQANAVYAGINATYDTALPSFNFSTTIDNGANYTDALNLSKDLARFAGSVKIDGNKIYDSANTVAIDFVSTTDVTGSSYNIAKFNTGTKNYGVQANFLNLDGGIEQNTKSLTTTANTITVLDSWPLTVWRSAKYTIQISNGTNHQMWEGMMIHDGTNIKITAYGDLRTGTANLATVSAGINTTTGKAELRVTPVNATSTKFRASKMLLAI